MTGDIANNYVSIFGHFQKLLPWYIFVWYIQHDMSASLFTFIIQPKHELNCRQLCQNYWFYTSVYIFVGLFVFNFVNVFCLVLWKHLLLNVWFWKSFLHSSREVFPATHILGSSFQCHFDLWNYFLLYVYNASDFV